MMEFVQAKLIYASQRRSCVISREGLAYYNQSLTTCCGVLLHHTPVIIKVQTKLTSMHNIMKHEV